MTRRIFNSTGDHITAQDLAAHLGAKRSGSGWTARCPAHDDRQASLSIREGRDGRVLIKCFAGCSFEQIVSALGLEPWQLAPPRRDGGGGSRRQRVVRQERAAPRELRLAPEGTRARVYSRLLDLLPLEEHHRQNLQSRGLSEEEIERRGYRSLPLKGRVRIVAELMREFGEEILAGVPGFVKRIGLGGKTFWTFAGPPGILIPVRNARGEVIALKVRRDKAEEGGKYVWISSASRGGPSPGSPVHVPLRNTTGPVERVRLTEGPLKADIATALSGVLTLGIGGVSQYRAALPVLQELGARKVILAFDADALEKDQVARALQNALLLFEKAGLRVSLETWDPQLGKGIDDLLAGGHQPEVHEGGEVWPALSGVLRSAGTVPELVVEARAELAGLEERLTEDPLEALEDRVLRALAILREERPAEAARLLQVIKSKIKGKIRFSDFEVALEDVARQRREALAEAKMPVCEEPKELEKAEEPEELDQEIDGSVSPKLRVLGPEDRLPEPPQIKRFLPDAPVPEGARKPERMRNWHLRYGEAEIFYIVVSERKGARTFWGGPVLLPTEILEDEEAGRVFMRVAWRDQGRWRSDVFTKGDLLDRRRLVALADHGLPVSSATAATQSEWLHDYEITNAHLLPRRRMFSRFGWTPDRKAFLWGAHLITAEGILEAGEDSKAEIIFRPAAEGDAQLARGYCSEGDLRTWLTTVGLTLRSYPRALTVLLASLSAPLLEILGRPGFVVDLSFRTSTGKTTALRVAASAWGRPDELFPEAAMTTWDTTAVGVERLAGVLHALPVILDDTKRARRPEDISAVVYSIASGRGRVRGNPRSLAAVRTWRTVLLSSGEGPITTFAQHGGLRTRVIELRGLPFGHPCPAAGQEVDRLNRTVQVHFGHLGPLFVRHLLRHRDWWAELKDRYLKIADRLASLAEAGSGRRVLEHAAVIELTRELLAEALQEAGFSTGWLKQDLSSVWTEVAELAGEAPPERRALQDIYDWAVHHQSHFYGREEGAKPPATGWVGRWDGGEEWEVIAFSTTALRKLLSEWGYNPDEVIEGWAAAGWLIRKGSNKTCPVRIDGKLVRAIVISRETIERVCGLLEAEEADPDRTYF